MNVFQRPLTRLAIKDLFEIFRKDGLLLKISRAEQLLHTRVRSQLSLMAVTSLRAFKIY